MHIRPPTQSLHVRTQHTQVLVDDLLVHTGVLPPVPTHARGILPTLTPPLEPLTISLLDASSSDPDNIVEG